MACISNSQKEFKTHWQGSYAHHLLLIVVKPVWSGKRKHPRNSYNFSWFSAHILTVLCFRERIFTIGCFLACFHIVWRHKGGKRSCICRLYWSLEKIRQLGSIFLWKVWDRHFTVDHSSRHTDMEKCVFLKIVRYVGSVLDHGHKAVHETKPLFPRSLDSYERGRRGSEGWPVVGHCRWEVLMAWRRWWEQRLWEVVITTCIDNLGRWHWLQKHLVIFQNHSQ